MLINKYARPFEVTKSAGDMRPVLECALVRVLDEQKVGRDEGDRLLNDTPGYLVVTDGFVLVNLPITLHTDDYVPPEGVLIHGDSLANAMKHGIKLGQDLAFPITRHKVGLFPRMVIDDLTGANYPNFAPIVQDAFRHQTTRPSGAFALDLRLLERVGKVLRTDTGRDGIGVEMAHNQPNEPLVLARIGHGTDSWIWRLSDPEETEFSFADSVGYSEAWAIVMPMHFGR